MNWKIVKLLIINAILSIFLCANSIAAEHHMTSFELKEIQEILVNKLEKSCLLSFDDGTSTLQQDGLNEFFFDDDLAWIEEAKNLQYPIAYNPINNSILPATISIGVTLLDTSETSKNLVSYLAFPRPSPVYLDRESEEFTRLTSLLKEAIELELGVLLAIREYGFVDDAKLISKEKAMNILGVVQ